MQERRRHECFMSLNWAHTSKIIGVNFIFKWQPNHQKAREPDNPVTIKAKSF